MQYQNNFNELNVAYKNTAQDLRDRTSRTFSHQLLDFRRPAFKKIKPKQKMKNSNFNPFYNNNY